MISQYGFGVISAGEGHTMCVARNWTLAGSKSAVLFCHGDGQTATQVLASTANAGASALIKGIVEAGYPLLSVDGAGLSTWGNNACMTAYDTALTWLNTNWGLATPVNILGISMGGTAAWNYALRSPANVRRVVCPLPVADLTYAWTNNVAGVATAQINTAYGGTYVPSTWQATKNPAFYATNSSPTPLSRFYYATDDPWTPVATYTSMAALTNMVGSVSLGTGGHTDAMVGKVDINNVLAFLL